MDPVQFGRFISEERKAKGLTQKELAEQLGVSDKAVSKWERGVCLPDVAKFDDIAAALGVTDLEVLRARRIPEPEPEQAVKPEPLLRWKQISRLLLGWLGVAVICFVGNMLEVWGLLRVIGLFGLGQIVLSALFGLWYGWRCGPVRNLSVHSAYRGGIATVALVGLLLFEEHRHILWELSDHFLKLLIPGGFANEQWSEWRRLLLNSPYLWPPRFLLAKFVCYEILDVFAPLGLYLEFFGFLLVRLLRTFRLAKRGKRSYNTQRKQKKTEEQAT